MRPVHDDVFGLGATTHDPAHRVADGRRGRTLIGPDGLDSTRELHARNVGRCSRRRRIVAGALGQVGPVQTGTRNPYEHVTRPRIRRRPLLDGESSIGDHHGSHLAHPIAPAGYRRGVAAGLSIMDDDGNAIELDAREAASLLAVTGRLEAATVSACPSCASRVIASMAFVDLLDAAAPFARSGELVELADDAPTLHLYVVDLAANCEHARWRDPLYDEWCEVVDAPETRTRR
jgi:hypothetical protein